jgi:DNA-binding NarL/FixJ family response regulator
MVKAEPGKEDKNKDGKCINILLAEDHHIVRSGLRSLIGNQPNFEIVGEAENGRLAVQRCQELTPDIILMDISMPELNGIEATRQILADSSDTKIIILSVHSSRRFVAEVFRAGACGYLLKNCTFSEMVTAINTVFAGGTYICPQIANIVREDYVRSFAIKDPSVSTLLSNREKEVLQLIAEGKNVKEIAFAFNLSVKTIETHRQHIMEKLDLHNIAALTKYAIREGLTSEEY